MRGIAKITGRNDDMIILRGVNLVPTQIEEIVLGLEALAPHFALELDKNGNLDRLTVRVERREDRPAADCEAACAALIDRAKTPSGRRWRWFSCRPAPSNRTSAEVTGRTSPSFVQVDPSISEGFPDKGGRHAR
jgi:phenylacetate-coenzyme A ligase PaaK-like adenylate-forming protein